jgi:hypothetical protein
VALTPPTSGQQCIHATHHWSALSMTPDDDRRQIMVNFLFSGVIDNVVRPQNWQFHLCEFEYMFKKVFTCEGSPMEFFLFIKKVKILLLS